MAYLMDIVKPWLGTLEGYPGAEERFAQLNEVRRKEFERLLRERLQERDVTGARRLIGQTLMYVNRGRYRTPGEMAGLPGHRDDGRRCPESEGGGLCSHELALQLQQLAG